MDKQLASVNLEKVRAKALAGQAMSLKEAAVFYGLSYDFFRTRKAQLPLVGEKLFHEDFILWRRRQTGLVSRPQAAKHRPAIGADRFGGFPARHD